MTTANDNPNNEEDRPRAGWHQHDRAAFMNTKEATNMSREDGSARPDQLAAELTPAFIEAILSPDTRTPAPCAQTWCDLGEVHDYTSHPMRPGDGLERFHERSIKGDSPLTVTVSALEHLDDQGVTLGSPTISIEDPDGREFTADEARAIAAALLVAAARLDEIGAV